MTQKARETFDVIILGAGASGLMCASVAAERGKSVLLADHGPKPGRKLAVTGGGKCNLTNRDVTLRDYVGENPQFCRSALSRCTPGNILDMCSEAGIATEEREHGQIFCQRSARDLVNFLVRKCLNLGCRIILEEKILAAETSPVREPSPPSSGETAARPRFYVHTSGSRHEGRSLVIALGGPAWPQVGASGTGYELARTFGHRIVPIRPVLTGLVMSGNWPLLGLSGLSTTASIRVLPPDGSEREAMRKTGGHNRQNTGILAADTLPLLFTHKGISGPATLQASLYWRKNDRLLLDFLPGPALSALLDDPASGKMLCRNLFRRHLPDRLCDALLPAELGGKKVAETSRRERERLTAIFKAHHVIPTGSEGFAKAEAAAGGVSTEDVSSRSMESKQVPGLFFCGEVLDVTGRLGGYNLHWAFASGSAAGRHV